MRSALAFVLLLAGACDAPSVPDAAVDAAPDASPTDSGPPSDLVFVAATFNTGTTEGLPHDNPPDDGYDSSMAARSDLHYGDGLSWVPAVEAAQAFLADARPDVIGFQEIFYSGECPSIPADAHPGFVCETWTEGDPTVALVILGAGYQVACQLGKADKCIGVRRAFGSIRGCDADLCLDGLDGATVDGCGGGSRVGRATVDLVGGGALTVVNVHGSSGATADDQACRVRQFEQVFVDLDGEPAARGAPALVLGDLNTDPVRLASGDPSAARFAELAQEAGFSFLSDVDRRAPATYAGLFNIDHVLGRGLRGGCWAAGVTDGHDAVTPAIYFDHVPVVCDVEGHR